MVKPTKFIEDINEAIRLNKDNPEELVSKIQELAREFEESIDYKRCYTTKEREEDCTCGEHYEE